MCYILYTKRRLTRTTTTTKTTTTATTMPTTDVTCDAFPRSSAVFLAPFDCCERANTAVQHSEIHMDKPHTSSNNARVFQCFLFKQNYTCTF